MAEQVYRRHRFRVYPTPRQVRVIEQWSAGCTWVWNDALEQRRRLYRDHTAREHQDGTWRLAAKRGGGRDGVTLSSGRSGPGAYAPGLPKGVAVLDTAGRAVEGQVRQLQAARAELDWLAGIPAQVTNAVLYRLDRSYQAAWRRLKAGRPAGFPRYRSVRRVALALPSIDQTHRLLSSPQESAIAWWHVPGARGGEALGRLRCRTHIPLEGLDLGELTLWERNGRWWGSVVLRAPAIAAPEHGREGAIVGVNRGLHSLLTLDDGQTVPPLQLPEAELHRLKHLERKAARQHLTNNRANLDKRGRMLPGRERVHSGRERRTREQIARLRERHANIRREQLHLIANRLLDSHQVICIERFDIARMMKGDDELQPAKRARDLHRKIAEQAWGELAAMLRYKAPERGCVLVEVDPAYISQTCPECGRRSDPGLERAFRCGGCGYAEDVDIVAARNVRLRGEAQLAAERERSRAGTGAGKRSQGT